jgi:hypothetical protein
MREVNMRLKFNLVFCLIFIAFTSIEASQQPKSRLLSIEQNGKCGYIDNAGNMMIPPQFDTCWSFSEGLAGVTVNNNLGFINNTGHFISEPQFNDEAGRFSEGFASVSVGNSRSGKVRKGFIDTTGHVTFLPSVTSLRNFSEGLAIFEKDGYKGYIDKNMVVVIEPKYKYAGSFYDGLARVQDESGSYYINKSGQKAIDQEGSDFNEGLARIEIKNHYFANKYGFIDTEGRTVIAPQFDQAGWFHEGLAAVQLRNKWGFIARNGKFIFPPQFEEVGDFSEGLAPAKLNGKYGYIDRTGKVVIPFEFDRAECFVDGTGHVKVDDAWGYVNKSGEYIWRPSN